MVKVFYMILRRTCIRVIIGLLLVLFLTATLSAYAQTAQPVRPNITLTPSMTVEVFPNGATRILYNLSALITSISTNASGDVFIDVVEHVTNTTYKLNSGGALDIKTTTQPKGNETTDVMINALFNINGNSSGKILVVKGNTTIDLSKKMPNQYNYSKIFFDKILLKAWGKNITLYVHGVIEGNATSIPEEYVGDLTSNITAKLIQSGITWIKVEKAVITKENDKYVVELNAELLIGKLVEQAENLGVITSIEGEETLACIDNFYRDLQGYGRLVLGLHAVGDRVTKSGRLAVKYEAELGLNGDIIGLLEANRKCSSYLMKLSTIIPFLIASMQPQGPTSPTPPPVMPGFIAMPPQPNLRQQPPYTARTTVNIRIEPDMVAVDLKATTPKLTYVENLGDPEKQAKTTLRELSKWLQDLNKQLAILALMGVPSPIPSTIKVKPVQEAEATVQVTPTETTLAGLAEVQVRIVGQATTTTKTQTTPKTTPTPTITTVEKTKTVTETVTTTMTTTEYQTITQTQTVTKTIVKETVKEQVVSMSIILAIVATIIIVLVIAVVVALLLRRR